MKTNPLRASLWIALVLLTPCFAHFCHSFGQPSKTGIEAKLEQFLKRFPNADLDKDGVLTREEVKEFQQQRRANAETQKRGQPAAPKPTHADVKYGDHDRQAFDIWLAESKDGKPTPLCIFIHGGGFRGGDKRAIKGNVVPRFLDEGISFASMNYRLTGDGDFPYPTAMHDAARGLQLIRSKASEWNINPEKIVSHGGSAGAGISLWLAFHDDLAEPDSDDPVARQSTRLLAAGTMGGQSTYDMRTFREWFDAPDLPPHDALTAFYGVEAGEDWDSKRVHALMEDASAITHLTKDDPPVYMLYSKGNIPVDKDTDQGAWVHHVLLGLKLQEAMKKLDLECIVTSPDHPDTTYEDLYDFLVQKLKDA